MRASLRAAAAGVALALVGLMLTPTTASAATTGPSVRNLHFQWVPGTGKVRVTGTATCSKYVRNAWWMVEMGQPGTGARAKESIRCDGKTHRVQMVLDARKGRFHPGHAWMDLTTMGCQSDVCWGSISDGFATIARPGKAHGPRGKQ
jgi:hypothetical protein